MSAANSTSSNIVVSSCLFAMKSWASSVPRYYYRIQVLLYRTQLAKSSASFAYFRVGSPLAPVDIAVQLRHNQHDPYELCLRSLSLYKKNTIASCHRAEFVISSASDTIILNMLKTCIPVVVYSWSSDNTELAKGPYRDPNNNKT